MDEADLGGLSSRRVRAIGLGVVAVVVMACAAAAYLHVRLPSLPRAPAAPAPQLSATERDNLDYYFVRPSVGWALDVRSDLPNEGADFWIFRTTDGARHWTQQLRGKVVGAGYSRLRFFDTAHGFVAVGSPVELYRTTDGVHWARLTLPASQAADIDFGDQMHGWLVNSPAPQTPNQMYATSDGGGSWFRLPNPPVDSGGLAVRSGGEIWLATTAASPGAHVYLSTDGGRSWQGRALLSTPPPVEWAPNTRLCGVPICSAWVTVLPGSGVVGFGGCAAGPPEIDVTSFDQGATWTPVAYPPPDPTSWQRITYLDGGHWWTMTAGALWKTSNAGQTWTYVGLQIDGWEYVPHALDSMHAWAELINTAQLFEGLKLTGLATTSDGGVHWTRVNVPHP